MDVFTKLLYRVIDILLLKQPHRTGLGVALGAALYGMMSFFRPALLATSMVDPDAVPVYSVLGLGVVVMHIPTIVGQFRNQRGLDEDIEQALTMIREAQRNGLPQLQAGQKYIELAERVLQRVQLSPEAQREIQQGPQAQPQRERQP